MQQNPTHGNFGATIAEIITHHEQVWTSAAKDNDSAKVAELLSEVFVGMDADGSMYNKSGELEKTKGDKWEVNEISDVKVAVHGNAAIASGAWHGKGTLTNGKTIDAHERWLDTWAKNGKWQCIASASTPIKA